MVDRYMKGTHSYADTKKLSAVAIYIQSIWRGYRVRKQFLTELALLQENIKKKKKKIGELDPKFWEDNS